MNSALNKTSGTVREPFLVGIEDVGASRALATVYENTTGEPLRVAVGLFGAAGTGGFSSVLEVQDANPPTKVYSADGMVPSSTDGAYCNLYAIVPPGFFYRVSTSGGAPSIFTWYEGDIYDGAAGTLA